MPENWVFLLKYWVVFYQQMNWIGRMNWIPDLKKKKKKSFCQQEISTLNGYSVFN